jgi:hypothetical protein
VTELVSDLLPPPPRKAKRRPGTYSPAVLILGYLCIPHVWIGIGLIFAALQGITLACFGTDIHGRITDVKSERSSKGSTYHTVTYVYSFHGVPHTKTTTFGSGSGVVGQKDAEIGLRVLTGDDAMPLEIGETVWRHALMMCLFATFWDTLVLIFGAVMMKSLWHRWLVRNGRVAQGRIESTAQAGRSKGYQLKFSFTPEASTAPIRASVTLSKRLEHPELLKGQPVAILYAPWFPWLSVPYRYAAYEVAGDQ